jgi:hypothetical protein
MIKQCTKPKHTRACRKCPRLAEAAGACSRGAYRQDASWQGRVKDSACVWRQPKQVTGGPGRVTELSWVPTWSGPVCPRLAQTAGDRCRCSCRTPRQKWWEQFGTRTLCKGTKEYLLKEPRLRNPSMKFSKSWIPVVVSNSCALHFQVASKPEVYIARGSS